MNLLFYDFQDLHGACLNADAAGDALAGSGFGLEHHHLHGAGFHALAALNAQLLVDHVNTGLGILSNGTGLANLHALTALDADIGLCATALCNHTDAGQILVEFLIKCVGAGLNTFKASHALAILINNQFLHIVTPFCI